MTFFEIFSLFVPKPLNQGSRGSVAKWKPGKRAREAREADPRCWQPVHSSWWLGLNQGSRGSVAKWIKLASQLVTQLEHNQPEWRSAATRLVPHPLSPQLLSNRRYRAPPPPTWLGSGGLKGAGGGGGGVPAGSLLTSTLAGCVLAGVLAGWLARLIHFLWKVKWSEWVKWCLFWSLNFFTFRYVGGGGGVMSITTII